MEKLNIFADSLSAVMGIQIHVWQIIVVCALSLRLQTGQQINLMIVVNIL